MKKSKFHFSEAIATLIPLAAVLGRNNHRYENLGEYLKHIFAECEKWKKLEGFKDGEFFSNEFELSIDAPSLSVTGSLTLDEWRTLLSELKNYVNVTPVSHLGKFYRMTLFSKLNQAIVLLSQSATKKGWERPKKELYHDFSSFPKNK